MIGAFNRDNFHYFCHWKQHRIRFTPAPINAKLQKALLPGIPPPPFIPFPSPIFRGLQCCSHLVGQLFISHAIAAACENPLRSSMTSKCAVGMPGTSRHTRCAAQEEEELGAPARKPWNDSRRAGSSNSQLPAARLPTPPNLRGLRVSFGRGISTKAACKVNSGISAQWLKI